MQIFPWFGKIDARTETAARNAEAAYKKIDFPILIDSQQMLLDHHLSYQRALANNRQKLAELEMLVGIELEPEQGT